MVSPEIEASPGSTSRKSSSVELQGFCAWGDVMEVPAVERARWAERAGAKMPGVQSAYGCARRGKCRVQVEGGEGPTACPLPAPLGSTGESGKFAMGGCGCRGQRDVPVAIKALKAAHGDSAGTFLSERPIMGQFDHPTHPP